MSSSVEHFVHIENIKNFKKRLEAATDDAQRKTLLTLLAEEEAKAKQLDEALGANNCATDVRPDIRVILSLPSSRSAQIRRG